ncbi:MAG TPA: hypothetical protein VEK08_26205 [Planctomycetota bacterium]|nr:hypothetical protein [Planctomycetota bacterium]
MAEDLLYICEICQTVLTEHHCKAQCPNCGRMFDCSDLPIMQANAKITDDQKVVPSPRSDPRFLLPQAVPGEPTEKRSENSDLP